MINIKRLCDGCHGAFSSRDIELSADGKLRLCEGCNYEYEAKLDNQTGGDDE
jgi:hypothetical protein